MIDKYHSIHIELEGQYHSVDHPIATCPWAFIKLKLIHETKTNDIDNIICKH